MTDGFSPPGAKKSALLGVKGALSRVSSDTGSHLYKKHAVSKEAPASLPERGSAC
jgi:hypothetical protein